jgi:hypothetical protein
MAVSRKCAADQRLAAAALEPLIVNRCRGCVDSLGAAVFFSYLQEIVTSGEIGLNAGAEGATAPETLRQTDRVTC